MRKYTLSAILGVLGLVLMTVPSLAHATEAEMASTVQTEQATSEEAATIVVKDDECNPALANCPGLEDDESPLSGGVDVLSDYMLADAIRPTQGWVIQPYASLDLGSGLSVNAWASKGLETDVGDEVDLGFTYERPLGGGVTGRLVVNHYLLLGGVPDMQEITLGVEKDGFDLSASYYPWAGGLQDGFRVTAKYNFSVTSKLSASIGAVYETGMEADDTFVPQASMAYDLGRGFSAKLNAYFPHRKDGVHERRVTFGIGWGF
ncbi:MAG: hypothetical protein RLZZ480_406 [Candidatus Parcubacteria bacterium]|jgi:hypothetical protein